MLQNFRLTGIKSLSLAAAAMLTFAMLAAPAKASLLWEIFELESSTPFGEIQFPCDNHTLCDGDDIVVKIRADPFDLIWEGPTAMPGVNSDSLVTLVDGTELPQWVLGPDWTLLFAAIRITDDFTCQETGCLDETMGPVDIQLFGVGPSLAIGFIVGFIPVPDDDPQGVAFNIAAVAVHVPEPGTLAIFGLGLAGLGFARRKRMI